MEDTSINELPEIKLIILSKYVRPAVVESKFQDWVLNGKKNWFYQYIIDRFNGSPTNAAIINSYIDLIYGNGLSAKNVLSPDWLKLKPILKPKDVKRIVFDFELYGAASMEIIETRGHKLSSISHIPEEKVVPSPVNKKGVIDKYWISDDWGNINQNKPIAIDAFTGKGAKQIYAISPYKAGKKYFSDPDYLAGMPYAEMEEEIANMNINSIKNGLSAGYIINVPDGKLLSPDEKEEFESQVKKKLTGSPNTSNFIISFNGRDVEITITPFPVNEKIHQQWQFLTSEARQQLLTAHRLPSPTLAGISTASGFSSTADEMDMAEQQLMKRVIKPKQNYITEALEEILEAYGINLDLHFIPLTEKVASPTELKKESDFEFLELFALDPPEGYDEFLVEEVGDEMEELDYEGLYNLVNLTGATKKSSTDTKFYKVRYRYKKVHTDLGNSRGFCRKLHNLSGQNKFFRKEDINFMSFKGVNKSHGHNGANYSIWKYKGGVNCKDIWERVIFKKKLQDNGKPFEGNPMQNVDVVKRGRNLPEYPKVVKTAPIDMPNNGHHPDWKP